jgi:hypothetical protein
MAGESTTTTAIEIVNSEWIDPMIGDYMRDVLVVAASDVCKVVDVQGKQTKTVAFPVWEKDTAADIGTEGTTTLSANDLTLVETTVTVAQVGILREPTKLLERTIMGGEAGLVDYIATDGGYLCKEMLEDDCVALFPSITLSVGATGVDLSLANMIEALGKRRTAKANGSPMFILDDQQTLDFTTALGATTGTLWSGGQNQSAMQAQAKTDGTMGDFLGAPIRYTNLTDTVNAGADVCGALLNVGGKNPSIGIVVLWMPELDKELNVAKSTRLYAINACWGAGLINDGPSVKLVTDA